MNLTDVKIGILPYDDGSGYRYELAMDEKGKVWLKQGSHSIIMDRAECGKVMDAIDALWKTADEIGRSGQGR